MSENLADMLTRGTDALNLVQSLQLIWFTLRTHDIAGVIWSLRQEKLTCLVGIWTEYSNGLDGSVV
jgi:hypothetical protein